MDLKNQIEQDMETKKRHQLIRRLSKAVAHTGELVQLTSTRCDARSNLEAEAYSAWMAGTLLLEKETDWEGALTSFLRSKQLLEGLFQVGDFEQRGTCRHFLDQVEPAVRFCEYQISRRGGAAPDTAALLASAAAAGGPGQDVLASKLASLAAEAQAQRAASTSEVSWNGETLPVRDDRCKLAVHSAQELEAQLKTGGGGKDKNDEAEPMEGVDGGVDPRVALYDRTINAYSEARAAARAAMQLSLQGEGAEEARAELEALGRALHGLELQHTIARNLTLAESAEERLSKALRRQLVASNSSAAAAKAAVKDKTERPVRAEDVARLYDTLVANASELNDLAAAVGGAAGETLMDDCTAKIAHYQAARCLYAAHACLAGTQWPQAAALFQRAEERCSQAVAKYNECATPDATGKAHLAKLAQQAKAFATVAAAESRAAELKESAAAAEQVDSLALESSGGSGSIAAGVKRSREAAGFLSESLDEWEAFIGAGMRDPRIARLPPPPALVPVRPIVLDTALMCIEPPSVEHRVPKKQATAAAGKGAAPEDGGMVSRLFGWGR
jgi:signal recognition particle subunit SRP68